MLLGQVYAMEELGDIYSEGKLVLKDIQEAMKWYIKASEASSDDSGEKYNMLINNLNYEKINLFVFDFMFCVIISTEFR